MSQQDSEKAVGSARSTQSRYWRGVIWGTLSGWALVFIPYVTVLLVQYFFSKPPEGWPSWMYDYNISLLLLLPLIQGLTGGLVQGRETQSGGYGLSLIGLISVLDVVVAAVFMREGVICLIMALPLLLALIAIGYAIGRGLARWRGAKTLSVSLMPLIVIGVIAETASPVPNVPVVVSDSIVVDAPVSYVWRYLVDYPDNPNPPSYWLWQAGLPVPTHSVAAVKAVGARRECRFTGGYVYGEVITKLEQDRRLAFRVTEQVKHPEIFGHISFDEGEMVLTSVGPNRTRLTMTGHYRLHVRPVSYFAWWSEDVTRHIHFRVMGYMKTLAERDYAADRGK